jgi:outer membrane protein insertion porin family
MKIFRLFTLIIFFVFLNINLVFAKTFENIKINGNTRVSLNSIIVLGDIDIKGDYTDSELSQIIKKLYETDFFENIKINISNDLMIINVVENPIIEDLKIIGVKNKKLLEFLEGSIQLKNRKSFSEFKAGQDLIKLKNISKSLGYYFAEINYDYVKNEEQNSIQLIYDLNLGDKTKIKKIIFLGNKNIKDKILKELITSEEHKFWKFLSQNVYLNTEQIALDQRLLLNYYKDNGYYNSKISNSFAELDNKGNFNLIFNINSGKKFYFNDFSLIIPPDFDPVVFEPINKIFLKLKDKKYSLRKLNAIISEVDKIATSRLYDFIDATIDERVIGDDKIDFKITIKESEKFYVERINILGNFNTVEEVIRHQLIIDEGDAFNEILFNKSINNIKSLNIFKVVNSKIVDSQNQNLKSIDITVEEQPTGEINLGAGFGTNGSTIGGGIKENNFLGKGVSLDTNFELSKDGLKGRFIYSKPNYNYSDNTLSTSLIAETLDKLETNGYKNSNIGFSLGTQFQQYENFFISPEIAISSENLETTHTASTQLKKQEGSYQDIYFNYGLNYDLRDRSYQPTSGHSIRFNQSVPLYSDNYELTNTFEVNKYHALNQTSDIIGKLSFFAQSVNGINGNDVRISKRLFIPARKLRGFEPGKVGPKDNAEYIGGNFVTTFNLASGLPDFIPTFENIDFSAFFDAANIWGVDYNSSVSELSTIRSSTGLSIDLLTPIGPLNFAFTQPISKASSDKTESFRFNLGTTF